jgi:hypothetical protein
MSSDMPVTVESLCEDIEKMKTCDEITVTDKDDLYEIHHYKTCDENSIKDVKNTRGVIKRGEHVVCKSFNFVREYIGDMEDLATMIKPGWSMVSSVEEGTMIRLWFDLNKWHISSHKKLSAFNSRWGCKKNHGDMFVEALNWYVKNNLSDIVLVESDDDILDVWTSLLDTSKIYTFIVRSVSINRIVCKPLEHPMLYFAGEFSRDNYALLDTNSSNIDGLGVLKFDTVRDIISYTEDLDHTKTQGVLVYYNVNEVDYEVIKIVNSKYKDLDNVRGNCPSLKFRYLQVRNEEDMKEKFLKLYPECDIDFELYDDIFSDISNNILNGYIARFIRKEYFVLPQEQWFIAKYLHDMYISDHVANKISLNLVDSHIKGLPAVRQNYLIRKYLERLY